MNLSLKDTLIATIPLHIGLCIMIIIAGFSLIQMQEVEVSLEANKNYNDDDLFNSPNVHYSEVSYRTYRSFPDFWNIEKVHSFIIASYDDGTEEYYTVVTDIETMNYEIM